MAIARTAPRPDPTVVGRTQCFPPSVTACSFELDVQWILDLIDKISEALRTIGDGVRTAFNIVADVLAALRKITGLIAWIPFVGDMTKEAVEWACRKAGEALDWTLNLHADVLQFTKNALAPWEIRSAGRQINSQIVPQAREFAESLNPANLASTQTWEGQAADRFLAAATRQYDFALDLTAGTEHFGQVVEQMGDEGVKSTIEFGSGLVKATASLIQAIIKVWAVPVGTAVAAKDIIELVIAIVEMITVWVEMIQAVLSQTAQLKAAANEAAPTSQWPAIAR